MHQRAYESLHQSPLSYKDLFRKAFIKREIMSKSEPYDVRLISGATDRFNAFFGPPLLGFSKGLSESWNKNHWIFYTSGTNAEDLSDWVLSSCDRLNLDFSNCLKMTADESRQDAHVSSQALAWEYEMLVFFGVDELVIDELRSTVNVVGFTRFGQRYKREGSRNTGDPITSSANSHMNAVKFVIVMIILLPPFDLSNPPFALAVQGDDLLSLHTDETEQYLDPEAIKFINSRLGFKVKFIRLTRNVVDVDYCSRYFWPTDTHPLGYVPAPKIAKVLAKNGFSKNPVKDYYSHNRGIALGLLSDVAHVPFLREWISRLVEITEGYDSTPQYNPYKMHCRSPHVSNSLTWDHLFERYNLTQNDLSNFVSNLKEVDTLPYKINFPGDFKQMLETDLA